MSLKNVEAMFVDGGRNVVFLLKLLSLFCFLRIHQCNKHVDISWEEVKRSVQPPFIIITQRRVAITKKGISSNIYTYENWGCTNPAIEPCRFPLPFSPLYCHFPVSVTQPAPRGGGVGLYYLFMPLF